MTIARLLRWMGIMAWVGAGHCVNAQTAKPPADLTGYLDIDALPGRKFVVESEGTRRNQPRRTVLVNVLMSLAELRDKYGVTSQLPVRYDRDSLLLVFAAVEGNAPHTLWKPYEGQSLLDPKLFFANCMERLSYYKRQGHGAYNDITHYLYIKPVVTIDGTRQALGEIVLTEPLLIMPITGLQPGQSDNVTINTLAPATSELEMMDRSNKYRLYFNTNNDACSDIIPSKLLLSRKSKGLYYYWNGGSGLMDGPNYYSGAEDFVYKPGVGILTGTYTSFTEAEGRDFKVTRIRRLK